MNEKFIKMKKDFYFYPHLGFGLEFQKSLDRKKSLKSKLLVCKDFFEKCSPELPEDLKTPVKKGDNGYWNHHNWFFPYIEIQSRKITKRSDNGSEWNYEKPVTCYRVHTMENLNIAIKWVEEDIKQETEKQIKIDSDSLMEQVAFHDLKMSDFPRVPGVGPNIGIAKHYEMFSGYLLTYWLDREGFSGNLILCMEINGQRLGMPYYIGDFPVEGDNSLKEIGEIIVESNFEESEFKKHLI